MITMNEQTTGAMKTNINGTVTDDYIFSLYNTYGVDFGLKMILSSNFTLEKGTYLDNNTMKPIKVSEFVKKYKTF